MEIIFIAFFIISVIIIIVAILSSSKDEYFLHPERRAGKRGEEYVQNLIRSVLNENDTLLTNISLEYENRKTELDNVIVNKYGVFIIEVKYYVGKLHGSEEDYEWLKVKTTDADEIYEKVVKNPIPQVKRQIDITARYLRDYGINVWVEGYAYFVNNNSAVDSEHVLYDKEDIDHTVHTFKRNRLSKKKVEEIIRLLNNN